jgi:hypothetical protein
VLLVDPAVDVGERKGARLVATQHARLEFYMLQVEGAPEQVEDIGERALGERR